MISTSYNFTKILDKLEYQLLISMDDSLSTEDMLGDELKLLYLIGVSVFLNRSYPDFTTTKNEHNIGLYKLHV